MSALCYPRRIPWCTVLHCPSLLFGHKIGSKMESESSFLTLLRPEWSTIPLNGQIMPMISHSYLFYTALLLSGVALWRFWRFTVYPALHPQEPKELPYWIPSEYIVMDW